jgi:hypothetical protein
MKFIQRRLPTTYEEQTYSSPYFIVRYPHEVRFRTAVDALIEAEPTTLLDYGAGDGHPEATAGLRAIVSDYRASYPSAMAVIERDLDELVAHLRFPPTIASGSGARTCSSGPSSRSAAGPR